MAEYRLTGEAFAGDGRRPRDPERHARARAARASCARWSPSGPSDPVRLDARRQVVAARPGRGQAAEVVSSVAAADGRPGAHRGHGPRRKTPAPGSVPEVGERVSLHPLTDDFQPPAALPDPEETPWTHGGPPQEYEPSDDDAQEDWSVTAVTAERRGRGPQPAPQRPRRRGRRVLSAAWPTWPTAAAAWSSTRRRAPASPRWWCGPPGTWPRPGEPLMIVAQTNEQVDDLVRPARRRGPRRCAIGRLSAATTSRPAGSLGTAERHGRGARSPTWRTRAVVIATAAKWATVSDGTWPWAIVDEAYQMRSDALLRVAGAVRAGAVRRRPGPARPVLHRRRRAVGRACPGTRCRARSRSCCAHNPDLPVHRLPVSWRLPASAAPLVSEAFYPFTGVPRRAPGRGDRPLEFARARRTAPPRRGAGRGRPRPAGRCTSCPPGTPCAPTRRRCAAVARRWPTRLLQRGAGRALRARQPARSPPTGSRSAPRTATRSPRSARRWPRRGRRTSRWTPPTGCRAGSTT